jgi:large subunit ribosomal protein L1
MRVSRATALAVRRLNAALVPTVALVQGGCFGGGTGIVAACDVVIAAPEAMRVVGALGQILGPRGLMPNPKVGTVTPDVAGAVKNARAGQVQFRADKAGIVQCTIGRASFTPEQLRDNLAALVDALNKSKPAGIKGVFLKKLSVSSTMGIGVKVDPASLSAQQ